MKNKGYPKAMIYYCERCQTSSYHFELQPHLQSTLQTEVNAAGELIIRLAGMPPFAADTAFMNRFASCRHCQTSTHWYYATSPAGAKQR